MNSVRRSLPLFGGVGRTGWRTYSRSVVRNFQKARGHRPIVKAMRNSAAYHEEQAAAKGLPFRTVVSGILHRYPVITRSAPQWDTDMEMLQDRISERRIHMMNDEMDGTDVDILPDVVMDFDESLASLPFQPASRITAADESGNRQTTDRRLEDSLFLLVKRNRDDQAWQFPQGKLRDEETLRLGAERVTDRAVGRVERWFVGNAPVGHYVYAYPEEMQKARGQYGAKVFFYRSQLVGGNIRLETRLYTDFAWVARDEVGDYLDEDSASYMQALLAD